MAEIVAEVLVYNSITNALDDKKFDGRTPFSLIEFLNYIGALEKTSDELNLYNIYLRKWQDTANITLLDINADLKTQFLSFLSEVKIFYSTAEEKRYLDNINLENDEELSISIPFFARKIKEISQYFAKKRKEINRDVQYVKKKGSHTGLAEAIKIELLDIYSGDDVISGLTIPEDVGAFIDNISIEVENNYDTFNDYYDLDPDKEPAFYDTVSGNRYDYFTSNTNVISGAFFYDTEQAIKDIINSQGFVLKEIPGLLVDFNTTDTSSLPNTFFQDYQNTGSSNLKYLLQAELVQKYMGTDMYYISSNSDNQVLSGKMFDADYPHRNLLNINNAATIQVSSDQIQSERDVGLFYKPTNYGIVKIDAAFEPVLDTRAIEKDTVYMFPDPTRYGNIDGVGGSPRTSPFIFVLKNTEFKNNSSSFGKPLVKSNSDSQNFYSYSSLEQDNFKQDNITPLYGIESGQLSGNIFKEVGDIYGNIYFIVTPTTILNRNITDFTPTVPPLEIAPTEIVELPTGERLTINDRSTIAKDVLVYNTIRDAYESINSSLSSIFNKYIYDNEIYTELNNNIIDIDIFQNTFFFRTPSYLIAENIVYDTSGAFNSKSFVSRVKKVNTGITVYQNREQISNISNPVRLNNNVFTIKTESTLTTSPINARTFNFSIFKYNLDTQREINIIDENTTNRSYFAENFTFDVGASIVQVKNMKLSYNSYQEKFLLITDFADINNANNLHVLVFQIKGNKLNISRNFVITPDNYNNTNNFYKQREFVDNFIFQSLSSTPIQTTFNGALNF
jgi:hypothetical protein